MANGRAAGMAQVSGAQDPGRHRLAQRGRVHQAGAFGKRVAPQVVHPPVAADQHAVYRNIRHSDSGKGSGQPDGSSTSEAVSRSWVAARAPSSLMACALAEPGSAW